MVPRTTLHGRVAVVEVKPHALRALASHETMLEPAQALRALDADEVVVDLAAVAAVNSQELGGLLSVCRRLSLVGRRVVLCELRLRFASSFRSQAWSAWCRSSRRGRCAAEPGGQTAGDPGAAGARSAAESGAGEG